MASQPPPPGFQWDAAKAAANLDKHGVAFTTAAEVFGDDRALIYPDVL